LRDSIHTVLDFGFWLECQLVGMDVYLGSWDVWRDGSMPSPIVRVDRYRRRYNSTR